jgi:DNA-directed RNA polymerase specialized sigma subunit
MKTDTRSRLIEDCLPLVKALAHRYDRRGEQLEDLVQVGTLRRGTTGPPEPALARSAP